MPRDLTALVQQDRAARDVPAVAPDVPHHAVLPQEYARLAVRRAARPHDLAPVVDRDGAAGRSTQGAEISDHPPPARGSPREARSERDANGRDDRDGAGNEQSTHTPSSRHHAAAATAVAHPVGC